MIPAALGRFEGELRFYRICRDCNSLIGKCEEQLLRCAPEALLRRVVRSPVKRKNRGTSWTGANGMPAPKFTIDHGDHRELVDASTGDPREMRPIDQIVVVDKKGEQYIRLSPEMTAASLRDKIESLNIRPDQVFLHADSANLQKYIAVLNELRPSWTFAEAPAFESGVHRVKGRAEFTFHADYWRAIAKIGFHYYLRNSRRGVRGDESEFDDIRRFIMEGGDSDKFFNKPSTRFALPYTARPDGSAILPHTWAHVLAADETYSNAVAMVSLFMGPEHLAQAHHIHLGRFKSRLIVPGAHAHVYEYYAEPSYDSKKAGRVFAVSGPGVPLRSTPGYCRTPR